MAIRLTGNSATTVSPDTNSDVWLTLAGEVVTSSGTGFDFAGFSFVDYVVHGSVYAEGFGIYNTVASSGNEVFVMFGGIVWSQMQEAIYMRGDSNTVINEGSVTGGGNFSAIRISGDSAHVTNYGTVSSPSGGIYTSGDFAVIVNHGQVVSENAAALWLSGNGGELINHGSATGFWGLRVGGSANVVLNQGTITGYSEGVQFDTAAGEDNLLINDGTVSASSSHSIQIAIDGGDGNETIVNHGDILGDLWLEGGDDVFDAGTGTLEGSFMGEGGDDTLIAPNIAPGTTVEFQGGADSDTVDLFGFASAVWVNLSYGGPAAWTRDGNDVGSGAWRVIAELGSVENIVGTLGVDYLAGNSAANTFTYHGTALIAGIEQIVGHGGTDAVDFSNFDSAVWVHLTSDGTEVWTRDGDNVTSGVWREIVDLDGIENFVGTAGVDHFIGNGQDNAWSYLGDEDILGIEIINGAGGSDTADFSQFFPAVWVDLAFVGNEVWTRYSSDAYSTSAGGWSQIADLTSVENLVGGISGDELRGNAQANTIDGGEGDDRLYGFGGADTFVFGSDAGEDTIYNFAADDGEKIDLSRIDAIVDFTDLVANHLLDVGGTAVIEEGANGTEITLDGWTVADFGAAGPISANDFIF